jgi:hypothetical protein
LDYLASLFACPTFLRLSFDRNLKSFPIFVQLFLDEEAQFITPHKINTCLGP